MKARSQIFFSIVSKFYYRYYLRNLIFRGINLAREENFNRCTKRGFFQISRWKFEFIKEREKERERERKFPIVLSEILLEFNFLYGLTRRKWKFKNKDRRLSFEILFLRLKILPYPLNIKYNSWALETRYLLFLTVEKEKLLIPAVVAAIFFPWFQLITNTDDTVHPLIKYLSRSVIALITAINIPFPSVLKLYIMWQMYHKEKNTFIGLIKPVYQRITRSVDEAKLYKVNVSRMNREWRINQEIFSISQNWNIFPYLS